MITPLPRRAFAVAMLSAALGLAACQSSTSGGSTAASAQASASEATAAPQTVSVYDLAVDDCWRGSSRDVLGVHVVDCEQPHPYQVFHLSDYPDSSEYPGQTVLMTAADDECLAAFPDYVGSEYASSEFYFHKLVPSDATWSQGDREIVCSLAVEDESDWTGSGKDSGR